eukprot:CAMPEP_0117441708 /NCGR_PEP_ID=MMETSP0759-20121206/3772_1 /TAXON_ID=63605 /ORGANISM="Percolomonas cosmopolitus, Strain WS" /LENGTH=426 /DNA_ID=CAMNT_0005233567 /DNA_START=273 /DNA_END=1553 /DNA_ORIENTATION=+
MTDVVRTYIVPTYYVSLHAIALLLSIYILLQIFLSSTKIFNSSKKRNPISSNSQNQKFVLKTLVFMLFCDILLDISDITYVAWEFVGHFVTIFQPSEEAAANIRSPYWIYVRVLRSIGIVSYTANYSSGCWTVCFAISLYLSLNARGKDIKFKPLWEIAFHFFATVISLIVCLYWCLYRNISTETEFFRSDSKADGIFVGTFYLYNLMVYIVLFLVDAMVCLMIWRLVSKSISKMKNMGSVLKKRMRASEWKLMLRLSLFLLPFLLVGVANCIWYAYLAVEAFTQKRHNEFEEYFIYYHSTIIPFKGILNAFIYGFNVHRFDKSIVRCIKCCIRIPKKKSRKGDNDLDELLEENDEDSYGVDYQHMGDGSGTLPTPTVGGGASNSDSFSPVYEDNFEETPTGQDYVQDSLLDAPDTPNDNDDMLAV